MMVPFTDKINFTCSYIVLLDFLFNIVMEIAKLHADIFLLLFLEDRLGDLTILQFIKQVEKREKQAITDNFRVEAIGGRLVPVAVGEQQCVSCKRGFHRLLGDRYDPDIGKEFLQIEIVIAFKIDNFDFSGELVEFVDRFSIMKMCVGDLSNQKVKHITHQKELIGDDLPFVDRAQKAIKRFSGHVVVRVGDEEGAFAYYEHIMEHTR